MQVHLMRFGAFLVTTLSLTCISADELRSGRSTLEVNTNGIRLRLGNERFTSEKPIDLRLAIGEEPATALRGAYRSVSRNEGKPVCTAAEMSSSGATFSIRDVFSSGPHPNTFRLTRGEVTVLRRGKEEGFQLLLRLASSAGFADHEYFIPGIWYRDNSKARPGGSRYVENGRAFPDPRRPDAATAGDDA